MTVTATPAPAPTVYVTNPVDKLAVETLQRLELLVGSQKSQISLLEKKLKKVCAVKPKPKGC